jgi:hypothetical protein
MQNDKACYSVEFWSILPRRACGIVSNQTVEDKPFTVSENEPLPRLGAM